MKIYLAIVVLVSVTISAISIGLRNAASATASSRNEQNMLKTQISISVDKTDPKVGDEIRIEQFIPRNARVVVKQIEHEIIEIGSYDKSAQRLVNTQAAHFRPRMPDVIFDGLPQGVGSSHNIHLSLIRDGYEGTMFRVTVLRPGIFLVYTTWTLQDNEILQAVPLLIVVNPRANSDGNHILQPEWFEDK